MVNSFTKRAALSLLVIIIAISALLSGSAFAQPQTAATQPAAARLLHQDSAEVNAAYLKTYFEINLPVTVSQKAFTNALLKLQPYDELPKFTSNGSALTLLDAVKFAIAGANAEELARVYSQEKIAAALAGAGITKVDAAYAPYLVCALDLGLIQADLAQSAASGGKASKAEADALLMAVADHNGTARNFLGYSDEPAIYGEIINNWHALTLFDDATLSAIGVELVTQQITTGFNLKSSLYDARFLPELTIRYGHSDIKHAQQLIGLLQSEGIVARLQFEPKISIYQYLPEWGEPSAPTPTYMVRKINDQLMLAYATEYDLVVEFSSQADMQRFDGLVLAYAKKNSGEEGKNLLYGSWWQPLYYTQVAMAEGYYEICDNAIINGVYSLHPFSLRESKQEVLTKLKAINPAVEIQQVPIWCDAPFYRYLKGEAE